MTTMSGLKFLTVEQKKFYEDNGFIKLGGVFTDQETESISKAYDDLFDRKTKESQGAGMESSWVGQRISPETGNVDYTAKGIHNLQMHSAEFTKVITHPKLLDAVEDIMGTGDILLHHTKAHVKPPGTGAPYPMHQDYHYFPFMKDSMLAVFLHLDDTTPENGGLAVYPGSHKMGPQEDKGLADDSGKQYHWVDQERFPLSGATPVEAKRGEIIVFSYLLIHGSYMNLSDRTRRMFLIQLRAADDEPTIMCHLSPAQNLVLRGNNVFCSGAIAKRYDR